MKNVLTRTQSFLFRLDEIEQTQSDLVKIVNLSTTAHKAKMTALHLHFFILLQLSLHKRPRPMTIDVASNQPD